MRAAGWRAEGSGVEAVGVVRRRGLAVVAGVLIGCLPVAWASPCLAAPPSSAQRVDATSLRGKVMCGYQGWFRCPGDAADMGWIHWSHDAS